MTTCRHHWRQESAHIAITTLRDPRHRRGRRAPRPPLRRVVGLSAGLIGPDGTPRAYPGSLDGTPVFLGCSDVDFHIPATRVRETAEVLARLGGDVAMRLYPGMGHTVNDDELEAARAILAQAAS